MILIFFIYIANIFIILNNFKTRVLLLRKNQPDFDRKNAGLPASLSFIGSFVSNSLLSFLLVEFFLSVILAILFTPLFWSFVSLYMTMALLIMIIMMIVKKLVIMIVKKLCLSDKYVRFPRLFGYFEFYLLFTNMYAGFITAFMRFIMLFIVLLLAIFRIDQSAIPQWVYNLLNIDAINNSYLGLIYMYHCHNHPLSVSFKVLLESFAKKIRYFTEEHYEKTKRSDEDKSIFFKNIMSKKNYLKDKISMARLLTRHKFKDIVLKDVRCKAILDRKREEEKKKENDDNIKKVTIEEKSKPDYLRMN